MTDKRLKGDIKSLKHGKKTEEDRWVAVVRPGQSVTLEHENTQPVCDNPYHRSVCGPDGVYRVMLPSGKTVECRPCTRPECKRPCDPVTSEELLALQAKNRGANAE
jgi:hypothetical protein